MINIKHFLDTPAPADGARIWVEPFGLTRDLCQWCRVNVLLPEIGPPRDLWAWFQEHPDGYEYFRGKYHLHLERGPHRKVLGELAQFAGESDITLLHQSDDPGENTATALFEFLSELRARL